ncbi:autotransporter outer membrane beta-barrel domain-containing protein [Arenimonas sp.]|uniref:autotransporter outer membrane beta-barrel domain-containing protein n=1 Tax=Arenimonas sp. TaxID=1872635 RepID=UPI0039E7216A
MNGNTTKGGLTKTRKAKTIKVAPATRAIRLALATSATMLALAGSGVTFAGTCLPTGVTETTCAGIFADTVNAGDEFPGVIDLTLILDDSVVITTPVGNDGVYASWNGDVTVTNYGSISVDDANGIEVNAYNGDGTVNNSGIIDSTAVGADVTTVFVDAYYGANVNNDGTIIAGADAGTSYDATGIYATGKYTNVTNSVDGEIFVGSYNGDATGVVSYATGYFKYAGVTNDGDITVGSFGGNAYGVVAQGEYVGVTNNGNIEVTAQGGTAIGVIANATFYDASVTNTGSIDVEAYDVGIGVYAIADDNVSIDNAGGSINVVSEDKYAIGVAAVGGESASVENSGSIGAYGYGYSVGIVASGGYSANVNNTGSIDVVDYAVGGTAAGITAVSGGSVYVYSNGTINVTATGDGSGPTTALPYSEGGNATGVSAISEYYSEGGSQPPSILYGPNDVNVVFGAANVLNVTAGGNAQGVYAAALGAGSVYVSNDGTINVDAGGIAYGIIAYSDTDDVYVYNGGVMDVYAYNGPATGIFAIAYDTATVGVDGSLTVESYYDTAIGVQAVSNYGTSVSVNGSVSADGKYYAAGVFATAYAGTAIVSTGADATIDSTAKYGSYGIVAQGQYGAGVYSQGDITVIAEGPNYTNYATEAVGIEALGVFGNAVVTNSGAISASTSGYSATEQYATGISATSIYGSVSVYNEGSVDATVGAYYSYNGSYAVGVSAQAVNGSVYVGNVGSITATNNGTGYYGSSAVGVDAYAGYGNSFVNNGAYGSIEATSAYGTATGVSSVAYGTSAIYNEGGSITANAYGSAVGIDSYGYLGNSFVYNTGSVEATSAYGSAVGVTSYSFNYDSIVSNNGTITADAYGFAQGVYSHSKYGDSIVVTGGDSDITATSDYSSAVGVYTYTKYGVGVDAAIQNAGDITAISYYAGGSATGAAATSKYGDATVINSGNITATAEYGATGISANAKYYVGGEAFVSNSGTVTVSGGLDNAVGISAQAAYGYVTVYNEGSITVDSDWVSAGVLSYSGYDTLVVNSGSIDVDGYYLSAGVYSQSYLGDITVANLGTGTISAYAGPGNVYGGSSVGVHAETVFGDVIVYNEGSIAAESYSYSLLAGNSIGVEAYTVYGSVGVFNGGDISASSESDHVYYSNSAVGVDITNYLGFAVDVMNTGSITASADTTYGSLLGYTSAVGVNIYGLQNGYVDVANAGDISAEASTTQYSAQATGVYVNTTVAIYGVDVINYSEASISAAASTVAYGYDTAAYAVGVNIAVPAYGDIYVGNGGDITATADVGYGTAYGRADAFGVQIYGYSGYNDVIEILNIGNISASATSGDGFESVAYATGISATVGVDGTSNIYFENAGNVTATAEDGATGVELVNYNYVGHVEFENFGGYVGATAIGGDNAEAIGALLDSYTVRAQNYGDVSATASGVYTAAAYGVGSIGGLYSFVGNYYGASVTADASATYIAVAAGIVSNAFQSSVYNEGTVSASATADDGVGQATAYGVYVTGKYAGFVSSTDSDISAEASGYDALAVGVAVDAYDAIFYNEGAISAEATGYEAVAVGAVVESYTSVDAFNSGDISAEANGDFAYAYGLAVISNGGYAVADNEGDITATSDGYAYGVWINGYTGNYVFNDGTITAEGGNDAQSIAIYAGDAYTEILNYGTINGAVVTGDGYGFFYNEGSWNAIGYSYLGGGDDEILNWTGGVINMTNASIDLGTFTSDGNSFYNYGLINVSGDNLIDMGGPQAAIPSLNPLPFYNYGTIDFQDGAPNDTLTIIGDFAGEGEINVDVSIINELSDMLYIDGSVVTGTVQTVNVDLGGPLVPVQQFTEIPVVEVTGVSVDSNFVLGDIDYDPDNSFLNLDFGLFAHINAANTSPDVHYLGIEVTGLNDPGTIAAAVAGGAQAMMNTQIGTWRQREGVISSTEKSSVTLWARVFRDKGEINPGHDAFNFGNGGNFNYDQKISGAEVGVDFGVTDEFRLGLLLAKTDGDLDLTSPGAGHASMDGDTWGVYGTWISPTGFYVDASYRWMDFDATMHSSLGEREVDGSAEAFNIEMGYAFTMANGLKVEPQFQYTRVNVDEIDTVAAPGAVMSLHGGDSSRARLGVALRKSFTSGNTVWTPHATLSAVREFDGENFYDINGDFFGSTNTEGTSALLELGVNADIGGNLAIFGGLNWQDGGAINNSFGGQLGIRYTFGKAAPAPAPVAPPPAKTCADLDDDGDGVNNCNDTCPNSTAGQAVGPDGCPVPLTIDLRGVNFDFDKDALRPDSIAILDEAVSILNKYPELRVEVAGHTDECGTDGYNQGLSDRRAKAVYEYLTGHGVDAGRLSGPNGYGESRPLEQLGDDFPGCKSEKNRRTELNVQN